MINKGVTLKPLKATLASLYSTRHTVILPFRRVQEQGCNSVVKSKMVGKKKIKLTTCLFLELLDQYVLCKY